MSPISRGFRGRRSDDAEAGRVPPGQYVTQDFPVLSAGPTPHTPLESWSFDDPRRGRRADVVDVGGVPALPSERVTVDIHCVTKWSKLGHVVDAVSRSTRCSTASRRAAEYVLAFSDGGYTTNLPLEDVTGGKAWIAYEYDDEPLDPEHGGPGAAARAASVLLEEREVGARPRAARATTSPASGRATATTTTETRGKSSDTPATDLAARDAWSSWSTETPRTQSIVARRCPTGRVTAPASTSTCGSPPRTATRRSAATRSRRRRRTSRPRAHRRAARRRRGLAVPDRRAPRRRRARAARTDRRLLRLGGRRSAARCSWSPAAPASCRCGRCSAITARSAATVPARLLYSARSLDDVIYRDELTAGRRRRDRRATHAHPRATRGLATATPGASTTNCSTRSPGRRRSARSSTSAGRPDSSRAAPTRSSRSATTRPGSGRRRFGRDSEHTPRRQRNRRRAPRDLRRRAHRSEGRLPVVRHGSVRGGGGRLHARSGPRRSLPSVRRGAHGAGDDPRAHLRRPARHVHAHAGLTERIGGGDARVDASGGAEPDGVHARLPHHPGVARAWRCRR